MGAREDTPVPSVSISNEGGTNFESTSRDSLRNRGEERWMLANLIFYFSKYTMKTRPGFQGLAFGPVGPRGHYQILVQPDPEVHPL